LIRLCVEQVKASSANQLQNWTRGVPAPAHTLDPVWLRSGQTSAHTQAQRAIVALIQLRRWTHLQAGTKFDLLINGVIGQQESKGESLVTFRGTVHVRPLMCIVRVHGRYLTLKGNWSTIQHPILDGLHEQNKNVAPFIKFSMLMMTE